LVIQTLLLLLLLLPLLLLLLLLQMLRAGLAAAAFHATLHAAPDRPAETLCPAAAVVPLTSPPCHLQCIALVVGDCWRHLARQ
jgi:hypothetical protein